MKLGTSWSRRCGWFTAVALALVMSGACSKRDAQATAHPAADGEPKAPSIDSRGRATGEYLLEEKFADPALASEPRLLFLWGAPGEPRSSVWSMKLDGTDVRRVVGPEVIYAGQVKELHPDAPVRSPDGRWIALVADDQQGRQIQCVVDVKEKQLKVLRTGGGRVHPVWTPDGKRLLFYSDVELWQFDVNTGRVEKRPFIGSKGFYFVEGGQMLAVQDDHVEYLDAAGKVRKRIDLLFTVGHWNSLSPDGKTLLVSTVEGNLAYASLDGAASPVRTSLDFWPATTLGPDGHTAYQLSGHVFSKIDLKSAVEQTVLKFPSNSLPLDGVTLVNARSPR